MPDSAVTVEVTFQAAEEEITLPFGDVGESDYYYAAVAWAVESGVTQGVTETAVQPGSPCTRGQIVTFLYRDMVN